MSAAPPQTPLDDVHALHADDRFVPLRAADLIRALSSDTDRFGPIASGLREVADRLRDVIEQEACAFESELTDRYAPLNPDPLDMTALNVIKTRQ